MTTPLAVFPLIKQHLPDICRCLANLPPSEFWIHESKIAEFLKLSQGPEHGPSDVLTCILSCMKKGFGGNERKGTRVATGFNAVDLTNEGNVFGVCYQEWGVRRNSRGAL